MLDQSLRGEFTDGVLTNGEKYELRTAAVRRQSFGQRDATIRRSDVTPSSSRNSGTDILSAAHQSSPSPCVASDREG